MWFKKKKDVDLRDLQRRGLIRIPKDNVEIETDREGFVDLRKNSSETEIKINPQDNFSPFNFLDDSSNETQTTQISKQDLETTRKLEELDNKIYKLEQRIDLLERKSGVGNSSGYSWER